MLKPTFAVSFFLLATFPVVLSCSSRTTCVPIPDGVYAVIGSDGGPTAAFVLPAAIDAFLVDSPAVDAAIPGDAASSGDAATTHDAATDPDAATTVDAGTAVDGGGTVVPHTYTFQGGLPMPYDSWDCTKPAPSCEMVYICSKPGETTVSIVTAYSTGAHPTLAFSVTPPGAIVRLLSQPQ